MSLFNYFYNESFRLSTAIDVRSVIALDNSSLVFADLLRSLFKLLSISSYIIQSYKWFASDGIQLKALSEIAPQKTNNIQIILMCLQASVTSQVFLGGSRRFLHFLCK